jgi:hypothetical protein
MMWVILFVLDAATISCKTESLRGLDATIGALFGQNRGVFEVTSHKKTENFHENAP